jgi:hypothetical protein
MKFILRWRKSRPEVVIEFQIIRAKVVNSQFFKVAKNGCDYDVKF